jgi:hypothetical protein
MERVADEEIEAGVEAEDEGDVGALRRTGWRVRRSFVVQGAVVAAFGGGLACLMNAHGWLGGTSSAVYLVTWWVLGGLWCGREHAQPLMGRSG